MFVLLIFLCLSYAYVLLQILSTQYKIFHSHHWIHLQLCWSSLLLSQIRVHLLQLVTSWNISSVTLGNVKISPILLKFTIVLPRTWQLHSWVWKHTRLTTFLWRLKHKTRKVSLYMRLYTPLTQVRRHVMR